MIPFQKTSARAKILAVGAALAVTAWPARAQSADAVANPPDQPEQAVKMSVFEVTSTKGKGYVSNNAARGFKTNQSLLEIPQADIVVTSDMIEDTAFTATSDVLQFVGLANSFEGETAAIRGSRVNDPYVDDMPDNVPYEDDVYVDSYEVIKGPTAVLYPNASLSGIVIKATKKPLPFRQYIVSETVTQWGDYRTTIDFNQPLGNLGEVKLGFRLAAAFEIGDSYWMNLKNKVFAVHPTFAVEYKNTTVRLAYDFQYLLHGTQNYSLMTPSGGLWTGWGRNEGGFPANDEEHQERKGLRLEFLQKISSDWESRFQAMFWKYQRYGSVALPKGQVNWPALTETYFAERSDQPQNYWIISDDTTGRYNFGPIKGQSTFGFTTVDAVSESRVTTIGPATANFGVNDLYTVSLVSAASVNAMVIPPASAYAYPLLFTRSKVLQDYIYYQQNLEVIPNRLSLVGGFTWANIETITDTNAAFDAPYAATDTNGTQWLHRFGAILRLTKDSMIYALDSTSFSPGAGVDYNNNRLPNINGKGDEVGVKTAFFGGKVSSTFSVYKMSLTNQAVIGPGRNSFNVAYSIPIGSTTSTGFDGDLELSIVPGFQMIATVYNGIVKDQTGNKAINATYDNSWSLFARYEFDNEGHRMEGGFKGVAVGGGFSRIGSFWQATTNFTVAPGYTLPPVVKTHEGNMINLFVEDKFARHWTVRVNCANVLNEAFVVGGQTPYKVDPSLPRTLSVSGNYKY